MIRAQRALTRQVQDFFLEYMVGVIHWDHVVLLPVEKNDDTPNRDEHGRRNEKPDSKFKEILRAQFGIYDLIVETPNQHPPLGWVRFSRGAEIIDGSMERPTWSKIAERIKQDHNAKELQHG